MSPSISVPTVAPSEIPSTARAVGAPSSTGVRAPAAISTGRAVKTMRPRRVSR